MPFPAAGPVTNWRDQTTSVPPLKLSPSTRPAVAAGARSLSFITAAIVRAALELSQYGYVLENGELMAQGSAEELASNDAVRDAYLGG